MIKIKKAPLVILASVLITVALWIVFKVHFTHSRIETLSKNTDLKNTKQSVHSKKPPPKRERPINQTGQSITYKRLTDDWDAASLRLQGSELKESHLNTVTLAISSLHGMQLAKFIDFVIAKGEFDNFKTYLVAGVGSVVSQTDGTEAIDWVHAMENPGIQLTIGYTIGLSYHGTDFENQLSRFSERPAVQRELLIGHCMTLMDDPVSAFKKYMRLKPKYSDYSDLKRLASSTTTNFAAVSDLLPDDSKSIAYETRNSLLKQWSTKTPLEAVNYITSNPETVSPKHIGAVIQTWMKSDPNSAIEWVESSTEDKYQEEGYKSIVAQYKKTDPEKAWQLVIKMKNPSLREELLKSIHAEWIRLDQTAAENARKSYSPQ